jgi:sigma-B regulation protein RsbU (phosphoserine phosphatase)
VSRERTARQSTDQRERELFAAWQSGAGALATMAHHDPDAAQEKLVQRHRALEAQLATLQREHDELHQALLSAQHVQRKLCAPRGLRRGRFEIASEIFPVRYVSGDFYDVLDLDGAVGLAVGDIAGKGLAAGLWFAHLLGLIRIHAGLLPDPAAAVAAINRDLCGVPTGPPTASLFLGRLDLRRGELVYSNAGQPPALLLRRDGRVESLREGGTLLGAFPHASFGSGRVGMEPGDTLIGYSDGIVECRSDRGEEFGVRRILAAARKSAEASAHAIVFSILAAAQDFAGSQPRDDDFTLMVVRRLDEGPSFRR